MKPFGRQPLCGQIVLKLLRATGAVLAICAGAVTAAAALGRIVVGLTDGDTIALLDNTRTQHKVRRAGTDALESHHAFGHPSLG